jgi:hypothetical protein
MMSSGSAARRAHPAGTALRARHRWTGVAAALMAAAAYAGVIGLAGGSIDMGGVVNHRLPLHSPVLPAVALLAVVALPMTAAAAAAWRGIPRAPEIVAVAGLALLGWIVVEIAFIRTFAWLQPVCAAYGALMVALGWRLARTRAHRYGRP